MRVDYEVLEPITDPFEALKPDAPLVHSPDTFSPRPSNMLQPITAFSRGDVDAALATAAHVIEATFHTQPIEIAFLEPEACLAVPQGSGVKVHTDSQGSVYDHQQIAKVLKLDPRGRRDCAASPSGGAFGAKEELSIQAQTALAALAAAAAGQDGADAQAVDAAPREAPCDDDGAHGRRRRGGASARARGRASSPMRAAITRRAPNARCAPRATRAASYRVPNVDIEAKAVYTNNPNAGAMRGFGSNQAQFAMEGAMDMLAERVGVDGWDIRDRNMLNPGDDVLHRPDHARERARRRARRSRRSRTSTRARSTRASAAASRAPASATARSKAATSRSACVDGRHVWRSSTATRKWGRASTPRPCRRCAKRPVFPPTS